MLWGFGHLRSADDRGGEPRAADRRGYQKSGVERGDESGGIFGPGGMRLRPRVKRHGSRHEKASQRDARDVADPEHQVERAGGESPVLSRNRVDDADRVGGVEEPVSDAAQREHDCREQPGGVGFEQRPDEQGKTQENHAEACR